jgi:hypothetical protein
MSGSRPADLAFSMAPASRVHGFCTSRAEDWWHRPTPAPVEGPTTGDHHTMRALLAFLLLGLTALFAGFVGFQAGVASNVGAAGGAVYVGWGFPFGFLFFPFFVLLCFGFLVFAFGGRRRGAWGSGYGPGRWGAWDSADGSDPRRQWVADAHRRLHEEEARNAGTTAGSAGTHAPSPFDPPGPTAG